MSNVFELKYKISEIFYSLQGEGTRAGLPCVFVRLQGCNLRCVWCDTEYALTVKEGGKEMTGREIIDRVKSYNCNFVEFTGGEPLLQKNVLPMMKYFCDEGCTVALETDGNMDVVSVDSRVIKVMDLKCPGSGMAKLNRYENIDKLNPHDEVKFVVANRTDYDFARDLIEKYSLIDKVAAILISPVHGEIDNTELAEWIKADCLPARLQLQMHKFIWGPDARGV